MNYLDLFSGIGGFHLGLKEAGFKFDWIGHSEIDKYAKQIYQKHFPESEDLGDVTNINVSELPEIDLITFGFPCQDLSIAGKRGGLQASRSGLFYQATRIIKATKPSYFIFENVKGLFSSNGGVDWLNVLREIADIGYDGQWQLLNTRWFLPQNRERIYFVGYPRERSRPEIFPIGEDNQRTTERAADSTVARAFTAGGHSGGRHSGMTVLRHPLKFLDRNQKNIEGDYAFTVDSMNTSGVKITDTWCIDAGASEKFQSNTKEMSPCLKSSRSDYHIWSEKTKIRRLTPLECARLQGFPDNWHGGVSDTQAYKCYGNAVSVPVVKAVGKKLIKEVI